MNRGLAAALLLCQNKGEGPAAMSLCWGLGAVKPGARTAACGPLRCLSPGSQGSEPFCSHPVWDVRGGVRPALHLPGCDGFAHVSPTSTICPSVLSVSSEEGREP